MTTGVHLPTFDGATQWLNSPPLDSEQLALIAERMPHLLRLQCKLKREPLAGLRFRLSPALRCLLVAPIDAPRPEYTEQPLERLLAAAAELAQLRELTVWVREPPKRRPNQRRRREVPPDKILPGCDDGVL